MEEVDGIGRVGGVGDATDVFLTSLIRKDVAFSGIFECCKRLFCIYLAGKLVNRMEKCNFAADFGLIRALCCRKGAG